MAAGEVIAAGDISSRTIRRVRNHLVPLLFLLYLVAFIDRTNIGFAALGMNQSLGFSDYISIYPRSARLGRPTSFPSSRSASYARWLESL